MLERVETLAYRIQRREQGFGGHSEHVLELVEAALQDANVKLAALSAIAFGAGPGAFTGLRVACAIAQGLGFGLDVPLVAVDCLSAIGAAAAASHGDGRILVIQDARMGELYIEAIDCRMGQVTVLEGPLLARPGVNLEHLLPIDMVCGSGTAIDPGLARLGRLVAGFEHPDAVSIGRLGQIGLSEGKATDSAHAAPLYVRDRVALTIAERAAGERLSA